MIGLVDAFLSRAIPIVTDKTLKPLETGRAQPDEIRRITTNLAKKVSNDTHEPCALETETDKAGSQIEAIYRTADGKHEITVILNENIPDKNLEELDEVRRVYLEADKLEDHLLGKLSSAEYQKEKAAIDSAHTMATSKMGSISIRPIIEASLTHPAHVNKGISEFSSSTDDPNDFKAENLGIWRICQDGGPVQYICITSGTPQGPRDPWSSESLSGFKLSKLADMIGNATFVSGHRTPVEVFKEKGRDPLSTLNEFGIIGENEFIGLRPAITTPAVT